jgi:hypothetical protein
MRVAKRTEKLNLNDEVTFRVLSERSLGVTFETVLNSSTVRTATSGRVGLVY